MGAQLECSRNRWPQHDDVGRWHTAGNNDTNDTESETPSILTDNETSKAEEDETMVALERRGQIETKRGPKDRTKSQTDEEPFLSLTKEGKVEAEEKKKPRKGAMENAQQRYTTLPKGNPNAKTWGGRSPTPTTQEREKTTTAAVCQPNYKRHLGRCPYRGTPTCMTCLSVIGQNQSDPANIQPIR